MSASTGSARTLVIDSAAVKHARTALGYAAITLGVTACGTIIGATVVAPVVSRASLSAMAQDALEFRTAMKHSTLLHNVPNAAWLYLGVTAAVATAVMVVWRLRKRGRTATQMQVVVDKRSTEALPAKLVPGRSSSRTPHAVQALADAGNAPADIARRTGLSLDAVSMCLTLSSLAARQ